MSFALITTEPKSDSSPINHKILLIIEYQEERALLGLSYLGLFARFSGGGQYRPNFTLTNETIKSLAFFPKIFFYMESRYYQYNQPKMTYENHIVQIAQDEVGLWPIHAEAISCLNQTSDANKLQNNQLPVIKTVFELFSKHFANKLDEGYSSLRNSTLDMENAIKKMPQSTHIELGLFFQELLSIFKNNVLEKYTDSIEDRLLTALIYYKEHPEKTFCNHCATIFNKPSFNNKLKDLFDAACRGKTYQFCSEHCFVDHLKYNETTLQFMNIDQFVPDGSNEAFKEVLASFGVGYQYLEVLAKLLEDSFQELPFSTP